MTTVHCTPQLLRSRQKNEQRCTAILCAGLICTRAKTKAQPVSWHTIPHLVISVRMLALLPVPSSTLLFTETQSTATNHQFRVPASCLRFVSKPNEPHLLHDALKGHNTCLPLLLRWRPDNCRLVPPRQHRPARRVARGQSGRRLVPRDGSWHAP